MAVRLSAGANTGALRVALLVVVPVAMLVLFRIIMLTMNDVMVILMDIQMIMLVFLLVIRYIQPVMRGGMLSSPAPLFLRTASFMNNSSTPKQASTNRSLSVDWG